MDDFLGAVVPDKHDGFEQSCLSVESDAKLTLRILFIERTSDQWRTGRRETILLTDAVLPS